MSILENLKILLLRSPEERAQDREIRKLATELWDLAAWSFMVENPVISERLRVPKAVGGFAAYDALIKVPLAEVKPEAIKGLHTFVIREIGNLPAEQREAVIRSFQNTRQSYRLLKTEIDQVSRGKEGIPLADRPDL